MTAPARTPLRPTRLDTALDTAPTGGVGAAEGVLHPASAVHSRRGPYSTQQRRVEHSRRAAASPRTSRPPPPPPPPLPPGRGAALRGSMIDETAALADIFAEMANDTAAGDAGTASTQAAPRAAASMEVADSDADVPVPFGTPRMRPRVRAKMQRSPEPEGGGTGLEAEDDLAC